MGIQSCMAETALVATEATVLDCPSKMSSLSCFVCVDKTNLFKVKKGISIEFYINAVTLI